MRMWCQDQVGSIMRDHDRFDTKANLTINNVAVTRCYVWRGSILDWTAVHVHSTLSFIILKQLRKIILLRVSQCFLWCIVSKKSTPKVITGYCIITLRSVFGYSIAVRNSLSFIYYKLLIILIIWSRLSTAQASSSLKWLNMRTSTSTTPTFTTEALRLDT